MDARTARAALVAAVIIWLAIFLGADAQEPAAPPPALSVADILARNAAAAGGAAALDGIRALSFRSGTSTYQAAADGRMRVLSSFPGSGAFESVLVAADGTVRRDTLERVETLAGPEAARWRCLARFFGGGFTPRLFRGPFASGGLRAYGPVRHHVLTARDGDADLSFSFDASDFLVKRLVLRATTPEGDPYELSCEFDGYKASQGIQFPSSCYFSQVGMGGTGAPQPRPVTDPAVNPDLPADAFGQFGVDVGPRRAAPGLLEGRTMFGIGYDDEGTGMIFVNWSREDVAAAGFAKGDRLAVDVDGFAYEAAYYPPGEENVPGAYDPGKAMLTASPSRPMFHLNFSVMPKEIYDTLKARFAPGRPVTVRLASKSGDTR